MKPVRKFLSLVTALIFIITLFISCGKSSKEPWKTIFNGVNFEGWSIVGDSAKAWVEDSAFVCNRAINTHEHTFIRTNEKYDDFILECDNIIDSTFTSGILIRCIDAPDTASVCMYGYQIKIDPSPRKWTGGIFDDFGSSWHWLYSLKDDARAREAYTIGKWNHFRIEAIGNSLKVWINGIPTCNLINSKYSKGYISLKIHSLGNFPELATPKAYLKNVRIITESPEKYVKAMDIAPLAAD